MPNIKSAIKRMKQSEVRHQRNRQVKSQLKTAVKKFFTSLEGDEAQKAQNNYLQASRLIDKAASKGVLHKRTAARKKSRLARKLHRDAS
ncbi:MAG TPA: 30S ribosomal protein S20 [Firmicutes bacterium]|nr:30S ribosomal protein S20 [Bacillota bacterium]